MWRYEGLYRLLSLLGPVLILAFNLIALSFVFGILAFILKFL